MNCCPECGERVRATRGGGPSSTDLFWCDYCGWHGERPTASEYTHAGVPISRADDRRISADGP